MNLGILPHFITLSMCVFVIFYVIGNLRCLFKIDKLPSRERKEKVNDGIITFLRLSSVGQIVMMVSFIIMQGNWVVSDYDSVTSDLTSIGWYVFDLANTFTQMMIALSVRVYMKWKRASDIQCVNYSPKLDVYGLKEQRDENKD